MSKLSIQSMDTNETLEAQYNPKELQIDQNVPWKKPDAATQQGQQKKGKEDPIALEFTGAEGRSISVEMLFDSYEDQSKAKAQVEDKIALLAKFAAVIDPTASEEKFRRPHQCMVTWGNTLPKFKCVIESLSTKYTMFNGEGDPLRATCTVKLKEANAVEKQKAAAKKGGAAPAAKK